MSSTYLPAETLDHIVEVLHDTRDGFGNYCFV